MQFPKATIPCSSRIARRPMTFVGLVLISGCSSAPSAAPTLPIDPVGAANGAIQHFDQDNSGDLSQAELQQCDGLLKQFSQLDQDGSNSISAEELANRFRFLIESPTRIAAVGCRVLLDGKTLGGATVKFVPEEFLGNAVMTGSGITNHDGSTSMRVPEADLPSALRGLRGIQLGLYRIEITHPEKQIPSKYNSETTLSREVNPGSADGAFVFSLKS